MLKKTLHEIIHCMKLFNYIILSFVSIMLSTHAVANISTPLEIKQPDTLINQTDQFGQKQGLWIYFGKDQPEKGYPDNGKISEGPFIDDRKEGRWIMYFADGKTKRTEGDFVNSRPNGSFIKYHPNGKVKERGTYSKRNYVDSLARFNEEGQLIYESVLNDTGRESGLVKYYYNNGQLEFSYQAENGIPVGKAIRYWPNGDIKEEIMYGENGRIISSTGEIERVNEEVKVVSPKDRQVKLPPKPNTNSEFKPNNYNKIFNSNKEIWMEGEFKNGMLYDGRLYIYDEDGLLYKVEVYKEGKYHSDGQL